MHFRIFGLLMVFASFAAGCGSNKQVVTANFVNPQDIVKISKFRSCCGHDYSGDGETNRSMKHYFTPKSSFGISNNALPIYAPFDGEIQGIRQEGHELPCFNDKQGYQILVVPRERPSMVLKIFHTNPLVRGGSVKAGELIAYADLRTCDGPGGSALQGSFDVSVESLAKSDMYSYFETLTDDAFNAWANRQGISSRESAIVTKEDRDSKPCTDFDQGSCSRDEISLP